MEIIEQIVNKLKKRNVDEYEIIKKVFTKKSVTVKNSIIEDFKTSVEHTCTLRVIKNKRLGSSYFIANADIDLDNVVDKAISLAKFNDYDKFISFYKGEFKEENSPKKLFNKRIEKLPQDKQIEIALKIEELAYSFDKRVKIVKDSACFKGKVEVDYLNSHGISKNYTSNYIGASTVVVANENDNSMIGYEDFVSKKLNIDENIIAKRAVNKAIRMLNANKGKSLKCPVIIENELVGDILTIIAPSFYIENIEKKKSLFANFKLNEKIGAENLTLIDTAINSNYIGSANFDDEGCPTNEKRLLSNGRLTDFLFNYYYANKKSVGYSGNSFLPNFKSNPMITYTNLIFKPEKNNILDSIKSLKKGLYLTNLMGLHLADPISGDFSLGGEGILIENGELLSPVKEFIVSGNILDILKNCVTIFDDTKVNGRIISPSILVEGLKISGN